LIARTSRRPRTAFWVALAAVVVALGSATHPTSADAAISGGTVLLSATQRPAGSSVVRCTTKAPPSGWIFSGGFFNPNACAKCEWKGVEWELDGSHRAYCHQQSNAVALYTLCVVCRDGEDAAATPARASFLDPPGARPRGHTTLTGWPGTAPARR
jgi:hypothetical protein